MITELYDVLVENSVNQIDAALIILDQSKAYDVVDHVILLKKLEIIGFTPQTLKMMASFLSDRKQFVQVEGRRSDKLTMSPNSVIQGSTLSCALFLILILDMPQIFHAKPHEPEDDRNCAAPSLRTFVDDTLTVVTKNGHPTIKEAVTEAMTKLSKYMEDNKLALNQDKSQIMIWTKDDRERRHFSIELEGKLIKHKKEVTILGNLLSETLKWDAHISKNVIPSLRNRVRTLRAVSKYMHDGFKARFANSLFRSKIMFGLETWGEAP